MRKLKIPKLGFNFKTFKISKLTKPGRVVVLASTGYQLCGAVASCTTSSAFSLGAVVLSSGTDRTAAVGEILAQLKEQSKQRLPQTAILLTPTVTEALLPLPVNPKKPRPAAQMAELARWELEELAVQQNELWTLGALLMGRGNLSHEQRVALESRAKAENQRLNADCYREVVDNADVEECLLLQEQLLGDEGEMRTGWYGQTPREEDEEGGFSWLVNGVGASYGDGWVKACKKHGLFLARIYPRLGAALPLLEPTPEWLLVDAGEEQWALFRGQVRFIDTLLAKPCAYGRVQPDEVVETVGDLLRPECNRLYLSAPEAQWPELAAALEQAFGKRGLRILAPGGERVQAAGGELQAALTGAAHHFLGLSTKGLPLAPIAAQAPPPPLWKRKQLYPWLAVGLALAGLITVDVNLRLRIANFNRLGREADIEYAKKMQLKKEAEELTKIVNDLQHTLQGKEKELRELERQRNLLDNIIRKRQDLVPGLLQALGEAIGDLVVLDTFAETQDRKAFSLSGWALTDTDGQKFATDLNETLAPWKYRVKDSKLIRGTGRLGLDGYNLNIWVVRDAAPAPAKPAAPAANPSPPAAPAKSKAAPKGKAPKGKGAK